MATKQGKRKGTSAKQAALHSHVASSLFSVSSHAHTGKRMQARHTSHGFLLIALLLTGVLLFANLGALKAYGLNSSGSSHITVNVAGDPPTEGAAILFPAPNQLTRSPLLQVSGSCPTDTLVALYNNATFAGSTTCTAAGDFAVTVQLFEGINTLQAQNYDGLNQAGPSTPQVSITYQPEAVLPETPIEPVVTQPSQLEPAPNVPAVPVTVPQPSAQPCYDLPNSTVASSTATPTISVNCIYRDLFVGDTLQFAVSIKGGASPYALLIDWGDGKTDLVSITGNAVQNLEHVYQTPGFHKVVLSTTDSNGAKSQIQTVVSVNGAPVTGAPTNPVDDVIKNIASIWIEAPVPLYIAAVMLVLGFWIGDIFQRVLLNKHSLHAPRHKRT
ncbi:MAG: hypothetical protein JWN28_165 [Candidatus Saccharibacteria bacterium]|nr:hypothetical protein [Candidatus Saccharibacteria bacterium]